MSIRVKYSFINKFIIVIVCLFLTSLNAYAVNSLSGVDIKQYNNNYKIILKLDNSLKTVKTDISEGNLTIVLDSVLPSDSVEMLYDNTTDIKNVTVQKKNPDNTLIILQGKNIENSKIYIKELSGGSIKPVSVNKSVLSDSFYIADFKYLIFSVLGSIFLFFILLSLRPNSKKYIPKTEQNIKLKKKITINSMKNSTSVKRYVPSINYNIRPALNMTAPDDLIYDSNLFKEEIRKVG